MVRVISNFFWNTAVWGIQQAISIIRFASPYAFWLVLAALGISFRLAALAIIASIKGMRPVARKLAQAWTQRAIEKGFPTLWELTLLEIFYALAIATILFGWVMIAFTATVTANYVYFLMH